LAIQPEPRLAPVLAAGTPNGSNLRRFRDRELLRVLVIGAAVARALRQGETEVNILAVTTADYELVRRLLQARVVCAADETCDPLSATMVGRANVFMVVKYGEDGGEDNPFNDGGTEPPAEKRQGRELVTRREIADLGNPNGRLVRRLIEYLQRQPDGYERFRRMGLVRRPPDRNAWRSNPASELSEHLRPWSAKQVRSHFDRLVRAGFVTAERAHGNGPWRYALPEELACSSSAFRGLPRAENLPVVAP
jgi:hypothetical protein